MSKGRVPYRTPVEGDLVDGRYELQEHLGGGGYGDVWRARDRDFVDTVAIKFLKPALAATHQPVFLNEARAVHSLKGEHHVIPIKNIGVPRGGAGWPPYIVMPCVDGRNLETLRSEVAHQRLEPTRAVRIVDQVAEAVEHVHRHHYVHRDVKPLNVLVEHGEDDVVHLVDFGLVGALDPARTLVRLIDGRLGSYHYMAPERHRLAGPELQPREVECSWDVYALGCLLYECLVGLVAFPQERQPDVLEAQKWPRKPHPSDSDHGLEPFDDLVVDSLSSRCADRPTVGEFRTRLKAARRHWQEGAVPASLGGVVGPQAVVEPQAEPVVDAEPVIEAEPEAEPEAEAEPVIEAEPEAEARPETGVEPVVAPEAEPEPQTGGHAERARAAVDDRAGPLPTVTGLALCGGALVGIAGGVVGAVGDPGLPVVVSLLGGGWLAGAAIGGGLGHLLSRRRRPSAPRTGRSDPQG